MAPLVNVRSAKFDYLSSIPETPMVQRENKLLQAVLCPPHAHGDIQAPMHINISICGCAVSNNNNFKG